MRLPRTKVFRAFPELDRYSDAQCRQIVKRARRANPATAIGCWISASLAFVVVAVGTSAVIWLVAGFVFTGGRLNPYGVIAALVLCGGIAVVIGLASTAALFVRDVSTRELLRLHLGGARCPGCGYPLAGLGINKGQIRCPKCGVAVESIGGAERSAHGQGRGRIRDRSSSQSRVCKAGTAMRIPVDKVFRAFPELDRFSDATCQRFVELAKRRWALRRWAWAMLAVGTFAGAFSVLNVLFYVVLAAFAGSGGTSEYLAVTGVALAFGVASVVGLSVRDFGLRQLLRYHITGASCPTCGYKLLGLAPIGGGVRCPECGLVVTLSELGMTADELLVGVVRARTDAAPVAPVLIKG